MISNVGNLLILRENFPYLRLISVWAVEIIQCIFSGHGKNINKKDVYA